MRMKFNKKGQLLLVSAASLLAASLVTACGTLTTDFVFVTSAKAAGTYNYGEIDVFEINSESGYMRQIPSSPFFSEGRLPISEALSSDNQNLYVVNEDDNSIVQFTIGSDGKLYPQQTVNTPGIFPIKATVQGSNLFVLDTYQPLSTCSTAAPCSGSVGVFPIGSSGTLGTAVSNGTKTYMPLCIKGYTTSAPYVCKGTETDISYPPVKRPRPTEATCMLAPMIQRTHLRSATSSHTGRLHGERDTGRTDPCRASGSQPSALAVDASSAYLYVTDQALNKI